MPAPGFTTINSSVIEAQSEDISLPIFTANSQLSTGDSSEILDRTWLKQAFLTSDSNLLDADDIKNRYWSSADSKFTDTRMGANIGINSRPQFTRYSDIRRRGKLSGRNKVSLTNTSGNYGMGRYYSEAIDDPSQTIYMRFGVQQFNSLTNFLRKAFDGASITYNRTGRYPYAYKLGEAVGFLTAAKAFPLIAIGVMAGKAVYSIFERDFATFYTIKPTMHMYWSTVNLLVNTILINKGVLPKVMGNASDQAIGKPFKLDDEQLALIHNLIPDVINTQNGIDVYALANKAQRIANQLFDERYDAQDKGSSTDFGGIVKKELYGEGTVTPKGTVTTLLEWLNRTLQLAPYYESRKADERMEVDPRIDEQSPDGSEKQKGWSRQFGEYFDAEFRDGSQFAVFKVDHTGSVSESFGNTAVESDLSQKINSMSSSARQARFTFADGNLAGGVGSIVQGILGATKDVAMGALDGVTFGFSNLLAGLGGSGYIDIPKNWQSSSANLPRSTYTMTLISPYGNAISQIQNIYLPLCMLLAGALPRSTGKASYTNPFLCQLYDRGRCQIKTGMIESLSVERGTSNLAFNLRGDALAIKVTFTVADLSSMMHMPTSMGVLGEADTTLDENNILSDYLAVLASQDIYSQTYALPRAKLRIAKLISRYNTLRSPALWAAKASTFAKDYTFGIGKVIELGVVGTNALDQTGNRG
jgi:hypothetical protein